MIIYMITNQINNKKYIGQTTQPFEERKRQYIHETKYRKDCVRPIISAMRKYGIENFSFHILEGEIETQEELDNLEIQYIQKYKTQIEEGKGYNLKYGGFGGKHAESTKKKIGNAQRGEKNHMFGRIGAENPSSIKTIELTTGIIYDSATIAAQYYNLNISHICAVCRGERGSTGGLVFRYLDNNNLPIKPNKNTKIKSSEIRNKIKKEFEYLL